MQRLIQYRLAMKLLDGEVLPGETVEVDGDLKKGVMTFGREGDDERQTSETDRQRRQ
jgi:hypothetical protein